MSRECRINPPIFFIYLAFTLIICFNIRLQGQTYLPADLHQQLNDLKRESRFDEALDLIENHIVKLNDNSSTKPILEAKLLKADFFRMKGFNHRSAELLDSLYSMDFPMLSSDDVLFGQLFTIRGTLHLTQGELKEGRSDIERAIEIYGAQLGIEDTVLGPCYNKLGNYHYFSRNYDSAMFYYSRALKLAERKKCNTADRASFIQNIGIIHLGQGNYSEAESCFLESLRLKESIYPSNSFSLGRIYLNVGKFYQNISELNKSLLYIEKAENIFSLNYFPTSFELGSIYWNKGLIFFLTGDYELAITYLFNAQQIIDTVFSENKQLLSSLHADIGNVYKNAGQYDKAILYYQLSVSGAGNILDLKTCRNLANLYLKKGNLSKAKEYYNIAMGMDLIVSNTNSPESAYTYLHYGEYLMAIGNDSALYYLNRAIDIFKINMEFHHKEVASSYFSKGEFHYKKGNLNQALWCTQKSLLTIANSKGDTNFLYNPGLHELNPDNLLINIIFKKAFYLNNYYNRTGNPDYFVSAGKTYLLCIDVIDQVRMSYRADIGQSILPNDIYTIYHHAIDHFINLHAYTGDEEWLNQAFQASEKGKSLALLSKFREANAKKIGLIPEDINKAEKSIISKLNLYRNNIWEEENQSEPDIKKLIYLRSNQLICEKKHDSLIAHLKQHFPDYYKLKYDHSVVSVKRLQKYLEEEEVIIEYTLAKASLFLFLITKDHFEVNKTLIDSTLKKDIIALRENLDFNHVPEYGHKDFMNYQYAANNLYKILIEPAESFISDKKLIIIPDEELSFLSFESLTRKVIPSDSIKFRHLPYLIKTCPVSYAASSTVFTLLKKGRVPILSRGVLALAPSTSIFTRSFLAQNEKLAKQLKLKKELPGATWEAESILKIMKGKKLIGDEATESEFKRHSSEYDILHFATHTRIDDENPLSSMLSFYPYDNYGEDGVLHTYEIYNLDLKGELAVLSACSTGDGKLQKGEGVISLARAFSYAGMPSVVMTLWDVEDISSGNIIPSFYHLLGEGVAKDVALQVAKLNYLEKTKAEIETHPAFWSGYVLYGNNRGFRQTSYFNYLILLFILGGLIIFISFVLVRRHFAFRKNLKRTKIDIPYELQPEDRI